MSKLSILALILVAAATCSVCRAQETPSSRAAVGAILAEQQDAWNRGDIDGFMAGYWRSDSLRFASGGNVEHGWLQTRDRYHKAYPDLDAMGKLTFTIYSIDMLPGDHAFVFGRYQLERKEDRPTGLFTLLFRRFEDGWRIVFDHTSADTSADGE